MKVLKNNFYELPVVKTTIIKSYPRKLICEHCESELEYEKDDMEVGVYGAMHVLCPLCGYNNMLDGNEYDVTLTKDNIEFPVHFHHTSKENGAVDICNNEFIKPIINKGINYLRENKDEFAWYSGSGNTMVYIFRMTGDEEYEIVVSDSHYSTYIPFEAEDY